MLKIHNKNLVNNAKNLRKNMTREERHLWYDFLKDYKFKFVRQKIIGNYIVDFCSLKLKLIIELDGSQHFEEIGLAYDKVRNDFLEKLGYIIIRIPNNEINNNFNNVCEYIDNTISAILKK